MIRTAFVLCFAALGVLIFASTHSAQGPAPGRKFAVLVGVEAYEHFNLRTPPLEYAVDDVTELARILRDGGYQVSLLTDDTGAGDESLAPTRLNIERRINAVLDGCKRSDTVILAFAGHGVQFAGEKDAYFCPQDAKPFPDKTGTLVSMKKIYGELETSFAGVKLIFVDACRNDPDPGRGRSGLDSDSAPPPKGVGALFSCSAGQRAYEHKNLKHGVFFHYVLEGLRGEAQDRQGRVTFPGLAAYVQENVPGKVAELLDQKEQLPNLRADLIGVPPVLLRTTLQPEGLRPLADGSKQATKDDPLPVDAYEVAKALSRRQADLRKKIESAAIQYPSTIKILNSLRSKKADELAKEQTAIQDATSELIVPDGAREARMSAIKRAQETVRELNARDLEKAAKSAELTEQALSNLANQISDPKDRPERSEKFPLTAPPMGSGGAPAPPVDVNKSPMAPPRTASPAVDDTPPPPAPPAPG